MLEEKLILVGYGSPTDNGTPAPPDATTPASNNAAYSIDPSAVNLSELELGESEANSARAQQVAQYSEKSGWPS